MRAVLTGAGIKVVGESGSADGALLGIAGLRPDVAIVEMGLLDGSGLDVCRRLHTGVCLRPLRDSERLGRSRCPDRRVRRGRVRSRRQGRGRRRPDRRGPGGRGRTRPADRGGVPGLGVRRRRPYAWRVSVSDPLLRELTGQERRLAEHLPAGLTNRQISVVMQLSEKTVENYLTSVMSKMGVAHRTQVAVHATRQHWFVSAADGTRPQRAGPRPVPLARRHTPRPCLRLEFGSGSRSHIPRSRDGRAGQFPDCGNNPTQPNAAAHHGQAGARDGLVAPTRPEGWPPWRLATNAAGGAVGSAVGLPVHRCRGSFHPPASAGADGLGVSQAILGTGDTKRSEVRPDPAGSGSMAPAKGPSSRPQPEPCARSGGTRHSVFVPRRPGHQVGCRTRARRRLRTGGVAFRGRLPASRPSAGCSLAPCLRPCSRAVGRGSRFHRTFVG